MRTPVAFLIFNRPETTARVFERIREAKPPQLLVVADGPRQDKIGEAQKCILTRAIIDRVDWDCELKTNYSEVNLGCKLRVSSGIDWVFQQVEEAIILEDDCVPDFSFFRYCEELLELYRHDRRIMFISGDNFQFGRKSTADSYYFSKCINNTPPIWGWATWRRTWQHYDVNIKLWKNIIDNNCDDWLYDILDDRHLVNLWKQRFQSIYNNNFDTWDYQLVFACWSQSGLVIQPNINLVSNIGYGSAATHSKTLITEFANMPVEKMSFPMQHSEFMVRDAKADKYTKDSMKKLTRIKQIISNPSRLKNITANYYLNSRKASAKTPPSSP
jgi:hypothetical protein